MNAFAAFFLGALLLAGAARADSFDTYAVPGARATMIRAGGRCEADKAAKALNYADFETCQLTAMRAFFTAIHLREMGTFETYADRMQALAADRDSGRLGEAAVKVQAREILNTFLKDCDCRMKYSTQRSWSDLDSQRTVPSPVYNIVGMRIF